MVETDVLTDPQVDPRAAIQDEFDVYFKPDLRDSWTHFGHQPDAPEIVFESPAPVFDLNAFAERVVEEDLQTLRRLYDMPGRPRPSKYSDTSEGRKAWEAGERMAGLKTEAEVTAEIQQEDKLSLQARRMAGWERAEDLKVRTIEEQARKIAEKQGADVQKIRDFLQNIYYAKTVKPKAALEERVQERLRGQRRSFVRRNREAIGEALKRVNLFDPERIERDAVSALTEGVQDHWEGVVRRRAAQRGAATIANLQLDATLKELAETGEVRGGRPIEFSVYQHSPSHGEQVRLRRLARMAMADV